MELTKEKKEAPKVEAPKVENEIQRKIKTPENKKKKKTKNGSSNSGTISETTKIKKV